MPDFANCCCSKGIAFDWYNPRAQMSKIKNGVLEQYGKE